MNPPNRSLFGPLQQTIDTFWSQPVTNWQRFFAPPVPLAPTAGDEAFEYHLLQRAGSYGRQLGTLISMIELLLPAIEKSKLTDAQQMVVDDFKDLAEHTHAAVAEYRGELGPNDAERIARFLEDSRRHFPVTFAFLKAKFDELTRAEEAVTEDLPDAP